MIPRQITGVLRRRLAAYPAVALVGPRQSGKTTLATSFAGQYFDMEQESDRLRVDIGWERLMQGTDLVIFDEAQAWPELFTRLRGAIDRNRSSKGRFLLPGSVSPSLMTRVSESLAGSWHWSN
ncbi:MAG: AAA family ATPase [Bryobacterales bacterium]|nr:AAA family ATPase [Bryobacterales bacterium]